MTKPTLHFEQFPFASLALSMPTEAMRDAFALRVYTDRLVGHQAALDAYAAFGRGKRRG